VGSLIFTGVENDKGTLATLERLGFRRPADISDVIRRWHTGSLRATRSPRARELLTKLAPKLLEALGKSGDPDAAFIAFDRFLAQLPAGVQVFSLFANNPHIFDVLVRVMTIAPELGRQLSRRAHLIEALLENNWPLPPPPREAMIADLADRLARMEGYEAKLNAARRWGAERRFDAAAQLVIGAINAKAAARQFTAIADAAILGLLPVAREETERQLGSIEGGLAVVGLGRLGAGMMTASSDVDLIFIYDAPADALSTSEKPVEASLYFLKLVRRALAALSATTEEGLLFEVDMQLRPSGSKGPVAVSISAFERYYATDAWTWEKMALVKSRLIAGDPSVGGRAMGVIRSVLASPRGKRQLADDVEDMRRRLSGAKPASGPWDVKLAEGGLADLDFTLEFLALEKGAEIGAPPPGTLDLVEFLAVHEALAEGDRAALTKAVVFFETIMQLGRAATGGVFSPANSGEAQSARMAAALEASSISDAQRMLEAHLSNVREIYLRIVAGAKR
jgi:glutamate-ammonia-ligase adenylyltransferase